MPHTATCFLQSFQSLFGHGTVIAARNPCWHSFSAFHNHPAARRYVRSTSAASRRESRACQIFIPNSAQLPASKLNASELGFRFLAPRPSPILLFLPPDPHIPPHFVRNLLLRPPNANFKPSKKSFKKRFKFFSRKLGKSWILASQNPPKILPKCLQKRSPKKH